MKDTAKAWYLDCEGEIIWFAKSVCKFDKEKETLEIPEWLYNSKFN